RRPGHGRSRGPGPATGGRHHGHRNTIYSHRVSFGPRAHDLGGRDGGPGNGRRGVRDPHAHRGDRHHSITGNGHRFYDRARPGGVGGRGRVPHDGRSHHHRPGRGHLGGGNRHTRHGRRPGDGTRPDDGRGHHRHTQRGRRRDTGTRYHDLGGHHRHTQRGHRPGGGIHADGRRSGHR